MYWDCRCDCGQLTQVAGSRLRREITTSCGCYKRDVPKIYSTTHGRTGTGEYVAWRSIKSRCNNPKNISYPRYGGRGIRVCSAWEMSFECFLADMGPKPSRRHSIERINSDGHYEPSNCRWATSSEQARNRRSNHIVEFHGEVMTLAGAIERAGSVVKSSTVYERLKRGWDLERAITEPAQ
jgi:hypothetical protein